MVQLAKPSWTAARATIGLIWQILYPFILVSFGFAFLLCAVFAGVAMLYEWFGLAALASGLVAVCLFIVGLGWAVREVTNALTPLEEETAYLKALTSQHSSKSHERTKLKIAK